ncbi:hypothetical protein AIOL_002109 [Candidatus Rhodobacter oscarellae]|uniref:HTH LytTR-type domain-containing protein n=1 Tax=Candidatus Rhodobacter oscarellae TaxID=1675527 RepID=A0A0J9E5T0_9RHOB|nr:LytTR family DNA-binding domain-containing protein [Candidatus Rhodobacter lobularis]KMW57149.1 hypothetical protein AIOL_002109 [Candidatus Rhodobacter lobularis]
MDDTPSHSALREWRAFMGRPTTLAILAGAGVVLGVAGPFDTGDVMRLGPRLAYWLVVVFATYGFGALVGAWLGPRLAARPLWLRVLAVASVTAVGVALIVMALNLMAFAVTPSAEALPEFLGAIFAITFVVAGVSTYLDRPIGSPPAPEAPPALPAILDRLPLEKRGALIALSVEDHYVRVQTTKGEELVLMRLSDAIREVGATHGGQVHRSHWAAYDQVTAARRDGDRAILTMSNGAEIPVSRKHVPHIKEAGLLPRSQTSSS